MYTFHTKVIADITSLNNKDTFIDDNTSVKVYEAGNLLDIYNINATIHYTLPEDGSLTIQIINIEGKVIETLFEGFQGKGKHETIWKNNDRGLYLYRLIYDNRPYSGKMLLY